MEDLAVTVLEAEGLEGMAFRELPGRIQATSELGQATNDSLRRGD